MAWDNIPRIRSFSLGDFHDYEKCVFYFFVSHHLEKKYELAEGSPAQAIGSLLDLTMKKFHFSKSYNSPLADLFYLIKAAEADIRQDAVKRGTNSFYGTQVSFLTPEVVEKSWQFFQNYYQGLGGKIKKSIETPTLKKTRPFWTYLLKGDKTSFQLWGGPDGIEIGDDGIPEVVDYKLSASKNFFEDSQKGKVNLDMDLMPKIYTLLAAKELLQAGFQKARFQIRFWQEPKENSFSEEFDLEEIFSLEDLFRDKIERILTPQELIFCEKDYCKACKASQRNQWTLELEKKGWIKGVGNSPIEQVSSDLPF